MDQHVEEGALAGDGERAPSSSPACHVGRYDAVFSGMQGEKGFVKRTFS